MYAKKNLIAVLLLPVLFVAACNAPQPQLPTTIPVAELPTATVTSLPATIDSTAVTTPLPTAAPTNTRPPAPTATALTSFVAITAPKDGDDILLGSDLMLSGLAEVNESDVISVTLTSLNGRLLTETQASVQEGIWQAGFTIPNRVSGDAFVNAVVQDAAGSLVAEHQVPVNLVVDTNTADRYLVLNHPLRGATAVGGFNLFFDGTVYLPTNSAITIAVWTDECQTRIARQSFTLGRSTVPFNWQGFVIVPNEANGPACAVAHFGEEGSEDFREAVVPIHIFSPEDEQAKGVVIANPPDGSHITAGRELLLYGTALNTSDESVSVSVLMENGRVISQSTAPADFWGYWEFSLTLPPDVSGPAKITVTANDATAEILINVDPMPTPES